MVTKLKKVIVTGCDGFIGRNLCEALSKHYYVVGVSRGEPNTQDVDSVGLKYYFDLTNPFETKRMIEEINPYAIFHLAANAIVKTNREHPTKITNDNVLATHNLLSGFALNPEGCGKCKPTFVFASSATVYGNKTCDLNREIQEETDTSPTSVYAATKVACEAYIKAYHSQGIVNGCILRLVANVGQYATHGLIKDIIAKLKSPSESLELLGTHPGSCKPFIHVSDTVNAMIWAMEMQTRLETLSPPILNVCAGPQSLTVLQVAHIVMNEIGIHKEVKFLGESFNWSGDNRLVKCSSQLIENLGWRARLTPCDAIKLAVREMENKDN